ncbi:MAG TPA: hypothetical protein VM778_11655 [Gemmatimonadota bacterium]|nr:hypothetical protein [Gemmatimonadota bacterium]
MGRAVPRTETGLVAVVMGGGYAPDIDRAVDIHFSSVIGAAEWSIAFAAEGRRVEAASRSARWGAKTAAG